MWAWLKSFFASFRSTPEAEPEKVRQHFQEIKLAPAGKKRADLARTIQPGEVGQMLQHALNHVEQQTAVVTKEADRASKNIQSSLSSPSFRAVVVPKSPK